MTRLAVIGLGTRSMGIITRARSIGKEFSVVSVVDPATDRAKQRLRDAGCDDQPRMFTDVDSFLKSSDAFDALLLGTNCSTHTPIAVQLAEAGVDVPMLLEKPVSIDWEQLERLAKAYRGREDRIVVSFPQRVTPLLQKVIEIVRSGRLGTINQVQAFNNVSYGGVYFGNWYRDFQETGGLWLQKATHDFDGINAILEGATPLVVAAMHTQRIYGGDMPDDLRCSECDKTDICMESPQNIEKRGNDGGMGYGDHWCAFSKSVTNHDAGSAMVMYDNGIHASYSQNFVSRRTSRQRGARITGYKATLVFDWIKERAWLTEHHDGEYSVEYPVFTEGGHSGGDRVLINNFFDIINGEDKSHTPLNEGILSAAMCLAARESARTHTFQPINVPGKPAVNMQSAIPAGVEV